MGITVSYTYDVNCPFRNSDFCDIKKERKKNEWKCGECVSREGELTGKLKETITRHM